MYVMPFLFMTPYPRINPSSLFQWSPRRQKESHQTNVMHCLCHNACAPTPNLVKQLVNTTFTRRDQRAYHLLKSVFHRYRKEMLLYDLYIAISLSHLLQPWFQSWLLPPGNRAFYSAGGNNKHTFRFLKH